MKLFSDQIDSPAWKERGALMFEVIDPHEFIRTAFIAEDSLAISRPPGFKERGCYVMLDLASILDFRLVASSLLRQLRNALDNQGKSKDSTMREWQRLQWRWWIEEICKNPARATLASSPSETNEAININASRATKPRVKLNSKELRERRVEVFGLDFEAEHASLPEKHEQAKVNQVSKELPRLVSELFHGGPVKTVELIAVSAPPDLDKALTKALMNGEGSADILSVLEISLSPNKADQASNELVLCIRGFDLLQDSVRVAVLEQIKRIGAVLSAKATLLINSQRAVNRGDFPVVHFPRLPEAIPWIALPLFLLGTVERKEIVASNEGSTRENWHPILKALNADIDAVRIISIAANGSLLSMLTMAQRVLDISDELSQ